VNCPVSSSSSSNVEANGGFIPGLRIQLKPLCSQEEWVLLWLFTVIPSPTGSLFLDRRTTLFEISIGTSAAVLVFATQTITVQFNKLYYTTILALV